MRVLVAGATACSAGSSSHCSSRPGTRSSARPVRRPPARRLRGADNTRARQTLDWQPRYPSWRNGFRAELTAPAPIPLAQKGKS